jgi:hypothetical protein
VQGADGSLRIRRSQAEVLVGATPGLRHGDADLGGCAATIKLQARHTAERPSFLFCLAMSFPPNLFRSVLCFETGE